MIRAFPDLGEIARDCPRACPHTTDEPECALDVAVTDGRLPAARVIGFRRLLASRHQRD